jgi:hypothetical protein
MEMRRNARQREYSFEENVRRGQQIAERCGGVVLLHRPYVDAGAHVNDGSCWCTPVILDWWEILRVDHIDTLENETDIRPN